MGKSDLIILDKLSKTFDQLVAVDQLSFTVGAGEVFGLLGPNGAGKTTTIRMLGALIGPTSGEAWVNGFQVGREDQAIRKSVGILTESPGLYDQLSAERNLAFFAQMYDVEDIAGQVERYLRTLGLWERRYESVASFSKGMRQKLAVARALLHEPSVLFLDEPTSGLDPAAARLVRSYIAELKSDGRAIILCTHNLDEAERLCDRVAMIRSSLLVMDTPMALRRKLFGRKSVFHLRGSVASYEEGVKGFDFVQAVEAVDSKLVVTLDDPEVHNPDIVRYLVEAGAEIQFVGELRHKLEDVYLQLIDTES
ncbi:MAG: ABC transporter ATP-binding protein [Chloroflexi bacterium]|nr:ABC transporter ATP-binding protein [Chloroflexota bacterium]